MSPTKKASALALSALGVVFGDIGTSPLYAIGAVFGPSSFHVAASEEAVYGLISSVIWSVTVVVSIKYLAFITRADNKGEGGIMALVAQIKGSRLTPAASWLFIGLGLVGISLFFGDSAITPAISVLSAVEGLKVVAPNLTGFIVPATLVILTALFAIQRYGTSVIGRLFGPVMLVWFAVIGLGGTWQIWQHPAVLAALSPLTALRYFVLQPGPAFLSMGAVVLAVTGAEALYADMGHFGRKPIARAWFTAVFPALLLCYMGQGALILNDPTAAGNPLVLLFPAALRIPVVILATLATVIASQSVISGTFSLTRQAVELNFLPKMVVRHTSVKEGGQIYLPFVSALMFLAVCLLVLGFGSSARLAGAYGIAVSGTLAADTILYLAVMRFAWQRPIREIGWISAAFLPLDFLFISATLPKLLQGGWFPVLIGGFVFLLITTWVKGQAIVMAERKSLEGRLQRFIDTIQTIRPPITRVPGTAIYIGHHPGFTPLALHATVSDLHELPSKVVIVSVQTLTVAHVPEDERAVFDDLSYQDGISYVTFSYGYHDVPNIPHALELLCAQRKGNKDLALNLEKAAYFVSMGRILPTGRHNLAPWRKYLYILMARNAVSTSDYYKLPLERTVEMQSLIPL